MKLGELQGRLEGLYKVATKTLPVKVSYAVSKNIKILSEEFKILDEQRIKICENYADKDENGKAIQKEIENGKSIFVFSGDNEKKVNEEYSELLSDEIEVAIHKVNASEFEKCEMSDRYDILTPVEFSALDFMID